MQQVSVDKSNHIGGFQPSAVGIDMDELKKKTPILFYEELDLYEDELADNGASILNLKVVSNAGFNYL